MIVVVEKNTEGKYVIDPSEFDKALKQSYDDGYSNGYSAGSNHNTYTPIVTYGDKSTGTPYEWWRKYEVTCSTDEQIPGQISMEDIIYQGETYNE